jgi:hypothetical protein
MLSGSFGTAVHHQVIEMSFLVGMLPHGLEFLRKTTTIWSNAECKKLKNHLGFFLYRLSHRTIAFHQSNCMLKLFLQWYLQYM